MPLGADTETCQGFVKTLCLSDGSHIETQDTEALLEFLWNGADLSRTFVWWNLGYDISSILKPWLVAQGSELTRAYQERLRKARRLEVLQVEDSPSPEEAREMNELVKELASDGVLENFVIGPWSVRVMGDKAWSLKRKGKRTRAVWNFDASKFFTSGFGGISLEKASRQYLGEGKSNAEEGVSRRRIGEEPGYFEALRDPIIRYCIRDAELTLRLFERTRAGYEALGMTFPDRPFSKGSVAKQYLRDHAVLTGTRKGLEGLERSSLYQYWRQAFSGGVFLLRRAGLVENPELWDINSAYPAAMLDLPSLEGASLVKWGDPGFERCLLKFYRVLAPSTPRTPIKPPGGGRKLYGWSAEEQVFTLTGPDLAAMDAYGDPYLILDGVGVQTMPNAAHPFEFLKELFGRKSRIKEEFGAESVEYLNLKLAINSFYGVMAQSRPRETKDTNFIYASYITARCRQQLWEKAKELEDQGGQIVSYATDGLVVSWGGTSLEHSSSTALGEWSVSTAEAGVFYETGIYAMLKEGRWSLHNRGMPGLDVMELQSAEGGYIDHSHASPVRFKQAVIQRDPGRVNLFVPRVRRLNPLQSFEEGALRFPREMMKASLADYWLESWPLWLDGEPHDGEDGIVIDGKLWRKREREEAREYGLGRSRRNPLHPMTLESMRWLGVEG